MSDRFESLVLTGSASQEELAAADHAFVQRVKSQRAAQMRVCTRAVEDRGDRVLRFITSDETVDRMGDIIRQDGWDLGNFRKNPVILFGHDSSSPPVGRSISQRIEDIEGMPSLVQEVEFATADQSPEANTVFELARGGFLNATSVGFLPIEVKTFETAEAAAEAGLGLFGVEFLRAELLETSVVSVPANPSAVQNGLKELVRGGRVGAEDAQRFKSMATVTERDLARRRAGLSYASAPSGSAEVDELRAELEELRDRLDYADLHRSVHLGRLERQLKQLRRESVPEPVRHKRVQPDHYADLLGALTAGAARSEKAFNKGKNHASDE